MKTLLFVILFSTPAFAEIPKASEEPRNNYLRAEGESRVENGRFVPEQERKFLFTGQPFGIGPGSLLHHGVSLGYYAHPSILLAADASISFEGIGNSNRYGPVRSSAMTTSAGIHMKVFATRWLYFRTGLNHRNVSWNYTNRDINDNVVSAQRFEGSSIDANLAIGSQWNKGRFTFGLDWVGMNFPMTHTLHTEELVGPVGPYTLKDLRYEEEFYLRAPLPFVARFYLGANW